MANNENLKKGKKTLFQSGEQAARNGKKAVFHLVKQKAQKCT